MSRDKICSWIAQLDVLDIVPEILQRRTIAVPLSRESCKRTFTLLLSSWSERRWHCVAFLPSLQMSCKFPRPRSARGRRPRAFAWIPFVKAQCRLISRSTWREKPSEWQFNRSATKMELNSSSSSCSSTDVQTDVQMETATTTMMSKRSSSSAALILISSPFWREIRENLRPGAGEF